MSLLLAMAIVVASSPRAQTVPASSGLTEAPGDDLFAAVSVNGVDTNLIVEFTRNGDDLSASGDDLRELGLDAVAGKTRVRLRSVRGLSYRIDDATQTVHLLVPAAAMRRATVAPVAIDAQDLKPSWGGLVNYSLYGNDGGSLGGTGELRVFGPIGALSTGLLIAKPAGPGRLAVRRLETSFVHEDAATLRRLTIGDFIGPDGSADGAIRGGGIQLATDFNLQPDLVTAPVPHLSGGNGVPSTVDVYVNGVRQLTQDVSGGRFAVSSVPMVDGAGQISLLVRDALGHQSVQQLSFYSSRQLLRPGLTASSVQVGLLRTDAFAPGDGYGPAFGAAAIRRGINDRLTAEVRLAAAAPVQVSGASLTAKIGELAILSVSADASRSDRGTGGQAGFSIRSDHRGFSAFATAQKTLGSFATLATYPLPVSGWRLQAGGAWQLNRWGQFSVSGTALQQDRARTRILAASWSRPLGRRLSAFANVVETHSVRSGLLVSAGLTIALSPRSVASVQASHEAQGSAGSVSWSQAADPDGGVSWRAGASSGEGQSRLLGGVTYRGQAGEVGADLRLDRTGASAQVFASGAAVWLGGRPELTGRVGQSFAMIETGEADVGVLLENRLVGRTRHDGRLLMPSLPTNTPAHIALDYDGIDLDHDVARSDMSVRPRGSGGAIIQMPIRVVDAMTVHIVTADGRPVPLGSVLRRPDGRESVVGYDGLAYLTDVGDATVAEVRTGNGQCAVILRKDAHDEVVCR